jgi:hypothetical protein
MCGAVGKSIERKNIDSTKNVWIKRKKQKRLHGNLKKKTMAKVELNIGKAETNMKEQ